MADRETRTRDLLANERSETIANFVGMATKEIVAVAPLLVLLYDRTFVAGTFRAAWQQRRGA